MFKQQIKELKSRKTSNLASPDYDFHNDQQYGNQYDEVSEQDTSAIGIEWVPPDIASIRAPELLGNLLESGSISPLANFQQ